MMKTATDFSLQVKKCERAIRGAHAANAELLGTTKATMTLALPQTYDDSNAGAGGTAVVALHMVGGPNFNSDAVSRVTNESGHKLETEVLAPLQRWQDVHGQLAVSAGRRAGGWRDGQLGAASPLGASFRCHCCHNRWCEPRLVHAHPAPLCMPSPDMPACLPGRPPARPLPNASFCPMPLSAARQARFRDLEKTRLELDSRRRTVTDMSSK